jgi:GT2 family glycosyltransferase
MPIDSIQKHAFGKGTTHVDVEPERDVDLAAGQLIATSNEPWLRVTPTHAFARRRWIRLRYSSSYFDDPIRPLIRFDCSDGRSFLQPMNGPVLGRAEWIGRIPDHTTSVLISPTGAAGPFAFHIDGIDPISRGYLVGRGLGSDRHALLQSIGAKLIFAQQERWETLKFAASSTPLNRYDDWHRRLYRPLDLNGLDRPRTDWSLGPTICLLMPIEQASPAAIKATVSCLRKQAYGRWRLVALLSPKAPPDTTDAFRSEMSFDSRLLESNSFSADAIKTCASERDLIAVIEPGGILPDYSLAVIAETFARSPELMAVYGDDDAVDPNGTLHSPAFKPVTVPNAGGMKDLTLIRASTLQAEGLDNGVRSLAGVIGRLEPSKIKHIRRILYRRPLPRPVGLKSAGSDTPLRPQAEREVMNKASPTVTIVIPTCDRAALLQNCLRTLADFTDYPNYDVVIVDNGSTQKAALRLIDRYRNKPSFQVISRPGPFNFSSLCNDGARCSQAEILVFLNNDVELFDREWLRSLVDWAAQPDVGAVGAKLLFPNGTIEHAGVVLGHGGIAGHLYEGMPASEPGYLAQLTSPRRIAAVTGACLAVQRVKFEAVGGFDSENLPIDLNDIDLCLKLGERGWSNVWTPHCVLYHRQSASRGYPLRPSKLYQKEQTFFRNKWRHWIRDDRFFHPALSLYSYEVALA